MKFHQRTALAYFTRVNIPAFLRITFEMLIAILGLDTNIEATSLL
jgi:hypothetical protein